MTEGDQADAWSEYGDEGLRTVVLGKGEKLRACCEKRIGVWSGWQWWRQHCLCVGERREK